MFQTTDENAVGDAWRSPDGARRKTERISRDIHAFRGITDAHKAKCVPRERRMQESSIVIILIELEASVALVGSPPPPVHAEVGPVLHTDAAPLRATAARGAPLEADFRLTTRRLVAMASSTL